MFERFTDRARRVVVLAQENARLLEYDYIGTEHLLLGLLHEEAGVAALVLADAGITMDSLRERTVETWPPTGRAVPGHIPFTDECRKAIELSLREALQLGHNYIGTEHVLLGLVREPDCNGATVLRLGFDLGSLDIRRAIIAKLSQYQPEPRPEPEPAAPDPWGDHLRRQIALETERPRTRLARLQSWLEAHEERGL